MSYPTAMTPHGDGPDDDNDDDDDYDDDAVDDLNFNDRGRDGSSIGLTTPNSGDMVVLRPLTQYGRQLKQVLKQLATKLMASQAHIDELQQTSITNRRELAHIQYKTEGVDSQLLQLRQDRETLKARADMLACQFEETSISNKRLTIELQMVRQEFIESRIESDRLCAAKDDEITALQGEVFTLQCQVETLRSSEMERKKSQGERLALAEDTVDDTLCELQRSAAKCSDLQVRRARLGEGVWWDHLYRKA
jgi:chromosome segregation ATPase